MTPEERELLNQSVALSKENNKMLHSMIRSQRIASVFRAMYWILIVGSFISAYYVLQPYLEQVMGVYSSAGDILKNFNTAQ